MACKWLATAVCGRKRIPLYRICMYAPARTDATLSLSRSCLPVSVFFHSSALPRQQKRVLNIHANPSAARSCLLRGDGGAAGVRGRARPEGRSRGVGRSMLAHRFRLLRAQWRWLGCLLDVKQRCAAAAFAKDGHPRVTRSGDGAGAALIALSPVDPHSRHAFGHR